MKTSRYKSQYDRNAYLRSVISQRWGSILNPKKHRSDLTILDQINALAPAFKEATETEIRARVAEWKKESAQGELNQADMIDEAFAMLREVSRRTTGLFHYDEQILGGLALARGGIAEMATGEGKTLTISLPAFLVALSGKGVHIMTVNSYLAERDFNFSKQIFDYLGIGIALLPEGGETEGKYEAYAQDITYGTGYEFGFDYMRDQLARIRHPHSGPGENLRLAILGKEKPLPNTVQRSLNYTIIDEVDSVLIDEAGSPLLISESRRQGENHAIPFLCARDQAEKMIELVDFELNRNRRSVELTTKGKREIYATREGQNAPWESLQRPWEAYVINALKALYFFELDIHYVVDEEKVVIVDEFTGRKFKDRTWREGLHQAVEAKEGVEIQPENESAASITRQRFFSLYKGACGLTGTASESAGEFWRFFKMPVIEIPLHSPSLRKIFPERIFRDHKSMYAAIVEDIAARHATGQPILLGTRTIRDSEKISQLLKSASVPHLLLTAKQDKEEDEIISRAGQLRSVMIATNMAGRGTDIGLSGAAQRAGGLHVICVERNESCRIDRQLVGRGARNGQPGSAQSFVSGEDYIIQTYAPEFEEKIKNANASDKGEISSKYSSVFDQVQAQVERLRYAQRVRMAEHDKWMEETKETVAT